jgi:hypothetical protein
LLKDRSADLVHHAKKERRHQDGKSTKAGHFLTKKQFDRKDPAKVKRQHVKIGKRKK